MNVNYPKCTENHKEMIKTLRVLSVQPDTSQIPTWCQEQPVHVHYHESKFRYTTNCPAQSRKFMVSRGRLSHIGDTQNSRIDLRLPRLSEIRAHNLKEEKGEYIIEMVA